MWRVSIGRQTIVSLSQQSLVYLAYSPLLVCTYSHYNHIDRCSEVYCICVRTRQGTDSKMRPYFFRLSIVSSSSSSGNSTGSLDSGPNKRVIIWHKGVGQRRKKVVAAAAPHVLNFYSCANFRSFFHGLFSRFFALIV